MVNSAVCTTFTDSYMETDMEEVVRQSFTPSESKLSNNARPPIQPAAAGKGSSGATAAWLAVAFHAFLVGVVFAGPHL